MRDGKALNRLFHASLKQKQPEDGDENTSRLPELKEGQRFEKAAATIREGKTSPPKHYTEDSLLAAMETAGAEDMPEDAERKGLGTSATRAATLEKLVSTGFVQRKEKQLLPTDKGRQSDCRPARCDKIPGAHGRMGVHAETGGTRRNDGGRFYGRDCRFNP